MIDAPARYDCAIIGTGPAGISAALTLKAMNKSFIWFGSKQMSPKIRKAELISNYPISSSFPTSEAVHSKQGFSQGYAGRRKHLYIEQHRCALDSPVPHQQPSAQQ